MRNAGLDEAQARIKIARRISVNLRYVDAAAAAAAAAKLLQLCLTLCDPIKGSPPGSPVPGILQARTLEWVAISFSNVGKGKVKVKSLSCARLVATPWTAAHQTPPSTGYSRQEYWSGVPLSFPICRWHHTNGRKRRGSEEPLNEGERGEWKAGLKLNIRKTKIMASCPITSRQIEGEKVEAVIDFIHSWWWLQPWN